MHARRRASAPVYRGNRSNVHILHDQRVLSALVTSADIGPGDLVVEFGAGTGVVTTRLADLGARVVAVELSPRFVTTLKSRFADMGRVTIVQDDARSVPLPHRPFAVVSNLPYSISTAVLRRVLGPRDTSLRNADVLVEWGFAKRLTEPVARDFETAWWQARFRIEIAGKIAPRSFRPQPVVASAHLHIRRKSMSRADEISIRDEIRRQYGISGRAARRYVRHR